MKRALVFFTFLFACADAFSQVAAKTTLTGAVPQLAGYTLRLSKGGMFVKEIPLTKTGSFSADLNLAPGFYTTNFGSTLYIEPGMKLSFLVAPDLSVAFTGQGSAENNLLQSLERIKTEVLPSSKQGRLSETAYSMPPADFLDALSRYKSAAEKLIAAANISPELAELNKQMADYSGRYLTHFYTIYYGVDPAKKDEAVKAMMSVSRGADGKPDPASIVKLGQLIATSRSTMPSQEDRKKLEVINNLDLNNAPLYFASDDYRKLIDLRLDRLASAERIIDPSIGSDSNKGRMIVAAKYVTDPEVKEHLLYKAASAMILRSKDKDAVFKEYLELAHNKDYISEVEKMIVSAGKMVRGAASPGFSFPDVKGKPVALADFKGSYVYIDLWATWCAPCIAEIPYLKKLEKDYAGKKMSFVSISTDQPSDAGKWKKFVADSTLSGIQVLSDRNSDFIKFYDIAAIPRFILLDPEGKIVSADANRPSNMALRKELDELLK